jgi:D-alanyl-D-alanine carboxypeptidase
MVTASVQDSKQRAMVKSTQDDQGGVSRRQALALGYGAMSLGAAGLGGISWAILAGRAPHLPVVIKAVQNQLKIVPAPLRAAFQVWPSLDLLAEKMVARKLTPGLSLSVLHDGNLLYSKGFGLTNLDEQTATTPQSPFRIASITKQFTAAAILKLAEQGKLNVTDPLSRFLPDFPRATEVILSELMSHTAGMGDYINGQDKGILADAARRDFDSNSLLEAVKSSHPLFRTAPGTRWLYSNAGFALLGIIVERVSGLSFADFCAVNLFAPAGMAQTGIDPSWAMASDECSGYRPNYRAPTKFDAVLPISPSFSGGAGAIRSTTEDLCRWHAALLNGKVLQPKSLEAMRTPVLLKNGKPAVEKRGRDVLNYGYGLALGSQGPYKFMSHGGRVNGFTGQLRTFPEQKLTLAILYNSDGGGAPGFSAAQKGLRIEAARLGMGAIGVTLDAASGATPEIG